MTSGPKATLTLSSEMISFMPGSAGTLPGHRILAEVCATTAAANSQLSPGRGNACSVAAHSGADARQVDHGRISSTTEKKYAPSQPTVKPLAQACHRPLAAVSA